MWETRFVKRPVLKGNYRVRTSLSFTNSGCFILMCDYSKWLEILQQFLSFRPDKRLKSTKTLDFVLKKPNTCMTRFKEMQKVHKLAR